MMSYFSRLVQGYGGSQVNGRWIETPGGHRDLCVEVTGRSAFASATGIHPAAGRIPAPSSRGRALGVLGEQPGLVFERAQSKVPDLVGLAWQLAHSPNTMIISGTSSLDYLRENAAAGDVRLDAEALAALDAAVRLPKERLTDKVRDAAVSRAPVFGILLSTVIGAVGSISNLCSMPSIVLFRGAGGHAPGRLP